MSAVLPLLACALIIYASIKRINVYEAFVKGALEALPMLAKILPYIAAMLICVKLLVDGGALYAFIGLIRGPLKALGMPEELLPLALLRQFSGSGAMAIVADIFERYGTDSDLGLMASTMMGASETIFYTLALYFGSAGIKKTGFTLPVSLFAALISVVMSVLAINWLF